MSPPGWKRPAAAWVWPSRFATTCWASGATAAPPASRRDNDIRRRKKSFPIVYALDQTDAPEHAALERVYGRDAGADGLPVGDEDVRGVTRALDALGARAASERAAGTHYDGFLAALADCGLRAEGRAALEEAGRFIVRREH